MPVPDPTSAITELATLCWKGPELAKDSSTRPAVEAMLRTQVARRAEVLTEWFGRSEHEPREWQELPVPERFKWVPEAVRNDGPAYEVGQMWAKFAEAIRNGTEVESDFDHAVRRRVVELPVTVQIPRIRRHRPVRIRRARPVERHRQRRRAAVA